MVALCPNARQRGSLSAPTHQCVDDGRPDDQHGHPQELSPRGGPQPLVEVVLGGLDLPFIHRRG